MSDMTNASFITITLNIYELRHRKIQIECKKITGTNIRNIKKKFNLYINFQAILDIDKFLTRNLYIFNLTLVYYKELPVISIF